MIIKAVGKVGKKQGFKVGDDLVKLAGYKVQDDLDYLFYDNEQSFDAEIIRGGKQKTISVKKKVGESLELEFDYEMKPVVCKNHCIFCFVDQLPKNMRESLYVKDDDYRYSFMCGSYVTMTNVTDEDIERIVRLKLSPLYISVHAYDNEIRKFMLKNPNTVKLIDQMRYLGEHGIVMHTQLVVVPGINDGKVLEDSIRGLHTIKGVETVAVVPVGLTGHRNGLSELNCVNEENARETIKMVEALHVELGGFCWCSDEYYVKANIDVEDGKYYGAYEQIENGVGLLAEFKENFEYELEETPDCKLNKRIDMITGVSFAPYLKEYAKRLDAKLGTTSVVHAVINDFFGYSVTVAGLVTAGDILKQVDAKGSDLVILPDNMLREFSDTFLDNVRLGELEEKLGVKIIPVAHDGSNMISTVKDYFEGRK